MRISVWQKLTILSFIIMLFSGCAKPNEPSVNGALSVERYIETGGYVWDISVSDSLIFITEDQAGFSIYNYLNNNFVCQVDSLHALNIPYENVRKIEAVDEEELLFVYDRYGSPASIDIFNITNRVEPLFLFRISDNTGDVEKMITIPNPNSGADLYWSNSNSLIFGTYDQIWVGNAEYEFQNSISGFDFNSDYLIIAAQQLGIHIVERTTGEVVCTMGTPGEALDVKIVDNYAYVALREAGFAVFDITDEAAPELIYLEDVDEHIYTVDYENDYLVLGSHAGGVYLYDVSNPADPKFLGNIDNDIIGYTYEAEIYNGRIFAATRQGVYILNID
ncbi:MAG: hypothetical protein ISS80_06545 [Candidatus Cloacimonetes bacterium]|nr:hypothetical protein [Candidatus Cloacimonadota bacterium]